MCGASRISCTGTPTLKMHVSVRMCCRASYTYSTIIPLLSTRVRLIPRLVIGPLPGTYAMPHVLDPSLTDAEHAEYGCSTCRLLPRAYMWAVYSSHRRPPSHPVPKRRGVRRPHVRVGRSVVSEYLGAGMVGGSEDMDGSPE